MEQSPNSLPHNDSVELRMGEEMTRVVDTAEAASQAQQLHRYLGGLSAKELSAMPTIEVNKKVWTKEDAAAVHSDESLYDHPENLGSDVQEPRLGDSIGGIF